MPDAEIEEAYAPFRTAIAQLVEYLEGKRQVFDLPLDVRGTPFQRKVYEAVARIPYGHTRSYAEIAREVGQPSAVRAVGSANGANPIPLVIPCHRVIASDGKLGGYGGGLPLKAKLLELASADLRSSIMGRTSDLDLTSMELRRTTRDIEMFNDLRTIK